MENKKLNAFKSKQTKLLINYSDETFEVLFKFPKMTEIEAIGNLQEKEPIKYILQLLSLHYPEYTIDDFDEMPQDLIEKLLEKIKEIKEKKN